MVPSATVELLPLTGAPQGPLEPTGRPRWVPADGWILYQGEARRQLFLLLAGVAREGAISPDGREAALDLLGPGDAFGNPGPGPSPTGVLALTDCLVLEAPVAGRQGTTARAPAGLEQLLTAAIAERLRRTTRLALDLMWCDVATRLERRLADLAARHGRPVPSGRLLELPLSQDELAALAGTTRESANRALRRLAAEGRVLRDGRRYLVSGRPH